MKIDQEEFFKHIFKKIIVRTKLENFVQSEIEEDRRPNILDSGGRFQNSKQQEEITWIISRSTKKATCDNSQHFYQSCAQDYES